MASTGVAPASKPTQALIGPLTSQGGFQAWYLFCSPDAIVAVRQGAWAGILLSLSTSEAPVHLGILGYLLGALLHSQGVKRRKQIETEIPQTPTSRLRTPPNVVYDAAQLRLITLKQRKLGPMFPPNITLESKDGKKQTYKIQHAEFDIAMRQLMQMFPSICKVV